MNDIKITKFRIGPRFRFNSGNPKAIRGTNLLTTFNEHGNKIYVDLPDDDWLVQKTLEEERQARIEQRRWKKKYLDEQE